MAEQCKFTTCLKALLSDTRANVMWLTTAALFPMIFLVGAGVDISRAYMVKTRLQAACDAGALAGRRTMGNNTWTTVYEEKAQKMFNANFRDANFGSKNTVFTVAAPDDKNVVGTATTDLPPVIFGAFGADDFALSASCESELNITDIDVAFVLDLTGSMSCTSSDLPTCVGSWNSSTQSQNEKTGSKIQALRNAVTSFDTSVKGSAGQNTEIRYAFVPYSAKVRVYEPSNANHSTDLPLSFIKTEHSYRTRRARFVYEKFVTSWRDEGDESSNFSNQSSCTAWATNNGNIATVNGAEYKYTFVSYRRGVCTRNKQRAMTYVTAYRFNEWVYGSFPISTSTYTSSSGARVYQGNLSEANYILPARWTYGGGNTVDLDLVQLGSAVDAGNINGISARSNTITSQWRGCVEEADTTAGSLFSSIPSGAKDFDFFNAPSGRTWKPAWGDIIYSSSNDHPTQSSDACPKVMRRLKSMNSTELSGYLSASNGFLPVGGTYHDVGMLWGVRMLAHGGVFDGDQKDQVSRHIIFMSDGTMAPNADSYAAYGYESEDMRVSGISGATQEQLMPYHNGRFIAACEAAKARGITVWVIAFGTTITSEMTKCASPGKTFDAKSDTQLTNAFKDIASRIADLRIVQ